MKRLKKRIPLPYPKPKVSFSKYVMIGKLPPASFPLWIQTMIFYVHEGIGRSSMYLMVSPVSGSYPIAFLEF